MAVQMAALDQFVTRARFQNDLNHTSQVEKMEGLSSNATQTLKSLGESLEISSTTLAGLGKDTSSRISDLQSTLEPLVEEIRQPLTELQSHLRAAPLVDYVHTGETPQKRDWNYPTSLPRTEDHESMLARLRGLPDPRQQVLTNAARTPGRSPRKMASPRKQKASSPSKVPSPSKSKIYTDVLAIAENPSARAHPTANALGGGTGGLKELDMNVHPSGRPASADGFVSDFSKSVAAAAGAQQQPPLKRHATAVEGSRLPTKLGARVGRATEGRENANVGVNTLGQTAGSGSTGSGGGTTSGRRLRSSPQQ